MYFIVKTINYVKYINYFKYFNFQNVNIMFMFACNVIGTFKSTLCILYV